MFRNVNKYIVVTIIILCTTLIYFNENKRQLFEKLLLDKYRTIPMYSEKELKDIPKPEHPHLATYQNNFMTFDPELGYVPTERLKEAFLYKNSLENNRSISWNNINSNMGGRTRTFM